MKYICDRCGKEWEYHYEHGVTAHVVLLTNTTGTLKTNNIDLCPECQEELRAWIEKGADNGKAEL